MKKIIYLLVFLIAFSFLAGCTDSESGEIKWKDPVVEAAFREWLEKPEGAIFAIDLNGVTSVTVSGNTFFINDTPQTSVRFLPDGSRKYYPGGGTRTAQGHEPSEITTLSDFANCSNLKQLELYSTALTELTGIRDLAKLKALTFFAIAGSSNLRDISGLAEISTLQGLMLSSIELDSFDELANIPLLRSLTISDTNIESLEPICNMKLLEILDLEDNAVSSFEPLAALDNMRVFYYTSNVVPSDLRPLTQLDKLELLYISNGDGVIIDSLDDIA